MYVMGSIYLFDIYSKTAKEARLLMLKSYESVVYTGRESFVI